MRSRISEIYIRNSRIPATIICRVDDDMKSNENARCWEKKIREFEFVSFLTLRRLSLIKASDNSNNDGRALHKQSSNGKSNIDLLEWNFFLECSFIIPAVSLHWFHGPLASCWAGLTWFLYVRHCRFWQYEMILVSLGRPAICIRPTDFV